LLLDGVYLISSGAEFSFLIPLRLKSTEKVSHRVSMKSTADVYGVCAEYARSVRNIFALFFCSY
jgi:hypothetical protein